LNILLISDWGGGLALSQRFMREGHTVKMWIKDPPYKNVGNGLVDKVDDYSKWAKWANLVICDDCGLAAHAQEMREKGCTVWGGTRYSDALENDRGFGQKEMEDAGLDILPRKGFSSFDEAIPFLEKEPKQTVFKPCGTVQQNKILTYVGLREDAGDMITFLHQMKAKFSDQIKEFELQDFVAGVEVGVSGFFNGKDFVEPIEISFEHKKLMNGDIGPATGEMGTTMFWTHKKSRLYERTIGKMIAKLQGYVGYFDINCIVSNDKIYPLEVTSRFGYPTIYLKMETLEGDLGSIMLRIAMGEMINAPISDLISMCVVVATPPWPYDSKEIYDQYNSNTVITIEGRDNTKLPEGIYPVEVRYEDGDFYTAGQAGFSMVVAGAGRTIEEAKTVAYDRLQMINIPNMMYRTDIGATWQEDMAKLQSWGWLE